MTVPVETPNASLPPARTTGWLAWLREFLPDMAAFAGALACAALAAVVTGLLGGCGGGVGTEGTGSFASGPITGFGSIVVNGVHFDESSATVQDDDALSQPRSALALGMVVQVTGGSISTDATGRRTASATLVRSTRALLGPVTAINRSTSQLTLLGQTVQVQLDTVFDPLLAGGLAGITTGQVLEVYGSYDASGQRLLATRIAPAPTGKSFAVRGTVAAVDIANKTAVVDGRTYSLAGLTDTSAVLAGSVLKLELNSSTDDQGRWVAKGGRRESPSNDDRDMAEAEGLITRIVSATQVVVDGLTIDFGSAQLSGTPRVGARLKASGALRSQVLVATSVSISGSSGGGDRSFDIEGTITSINTSTKRFVVRGVTISYARPDIRFDAPASAAALASFTGKVEVEGVLSADGTVVEATRIKFDN